MKNKYLFGVLVSAMILVQACATDSTFQPESERRSIDAVIDDFHDAAAKGDKERYLGHFSENGVFMGTDDWERWPLPEFTQYVDGRFKDGEGWIYKPTERHVNFSASGQTAWFDEIPQSEKWGRFRGTGVLIKENGIWKLAHYSMSVLVPNDAWEETLKLTKAAYEQRNTKEKNGSR